jgi:hypothetical protein
MKNQIQKKAYACGMLMVVVFLLLSSQKLCAQNSVISEYVGAWVAPNTAVTFRTKVRWLKFSFVKSNVNLSLILEANHKASGSIGDAKFFGVDVKENKGSSSVNGITYIISCGELSQICEADSKQHKRIELWLKPTNEKGIFKAEIRLIDGLDTFPMGEAMFKLKSKE